MNAIKRIIDAVSKIKNGTFFRISYRTTVPVKSAYKDTVKIEKFVDTTVRTGINYRNTKSYVAPVSSITRKNNNIWLESNKNKIKYNFNTDKLYINLYTMQSGDNSHIKYRVSINGDVSVCNSLNNFREYVQNSYFTKSKSGMYQVTLDNVYKINGVCFTE